MDKTKMILAIKISSKIQAIQKDNKLTEKEKEKDELIELQIIKALNYKDN